MAKSVLRKCWDKITDARIKIGLCSSKCRRNRLAERIVDSGIFTMPDREECYKVITESHEKINKLKRREDHTAEELALIDTKVDLRKNTASYSDMPTELFKDKLELIIKTATAEIADLIKASYGEENWEKVVGGVYLSDIDMFSRGSETVAISCDLPDIPELKGTCLEEVLKNMTSKLIVDSFENVMILVFNRLDSNIRHAMHKLGIKNRIEKSVQNNVDETNDIAKIIGTTDGEVTIVRRSEG